MSRYEESSRQKIKFLKKCFLCGQIYFTRTLIKKIQQISGCQAKKLPFKYLGAPLYKGLCTNQYLTRWLINLLNELKGGM